LLEHFANRAFGALDVRPRDVIAVVLLGVVAGLLAAVVPARAAAGRPALDMLRNRFPADGGANRNPRWATLAVVAGPAIVVLSAMGWHQSLSGFRSAFTPIRSTGDVLPALGRAMADNPWAAGIWLGSAMTLAGLVHSCPALIGRLGRLASRAPLTPRLALRDASRHRHRTAPATAAVMTVVAGASIVAFVVASTDARDRAAYAPSAPVGTITVTAGHGSLDAVAQLVAAGVGSPATVHPVAQASGPQPWGRLAPCDPRNDVARCRAVVKVVDAPTLALLTGKTVGEIENVFTPGHAVVVGATASPRTNGVVVGRQRTSLPATVLPGAPIYTGSADVYLLPDTARQADVRSAQSFVLVKPDRLPSSDALAKLQHDLGQNVYLYAERGYHGDYSLVLLALLGAAAVATLAGTSIAVALAMAESRADMATLAAVGASPGRRRLQAIGQAATVGSLGTLLGLALGALVAVATLSGSNLYPTSVPWLWLAGLAATAPLLSMLVAGAFTRSRIPLTRRIA
jgi:putative ABC transport system permease protein